jgi:hypothetical protein
MSWDIEKSTERCCACGGQFPVGADYVASLVEAGDSFARRDYCPACWGEGREVFSFWRTRVPRKEEKKRTFVDDQMLMDLFRRLADSPEAPRRKFRFVLALILMRKRLVKFEETLRRDGEEYWVLSCRDAAERTEVWDPKLTEPEIQQVSGDLSAILNAEI